MKGKRGQAGGEVRRVTSITRKLHRSFILKKLGIFIRMDVFFFVLAAAAFLAGQEYGKNGAIFREASRSIKRGASGRTLIYNVVDKTGKALLTRRVDQELYIAGMVLLGIFFLQSDDPAADRA